MPTSRATLFTKEDCAPCLNTKKYIYDNFCQDEADHRLLDVLTVLGKEDHPALIAAFEIDKFPTLITHLDGEEFDRFVGGKSIRANLRYILTSLADKNYTNQ